MFREYGFGTIKYGGVEHEVKPTFENMDKLGDEKDLIDIATFLSGGYETMGLQGLIVVLQRAEKVVRACCNSLPDSYFNQFKVMPNGKVKATRNGFKDCFALIAVARHCVKHGIIGAVKPKRIGNGDSKPYNAAEYVRSAMMIFEISKDDAANMTMTEFVTYCNDRVKDVDSGENLTGKEKRALILEQMERDKRGK